MDPRLKKAIKRSVPPAVTDPSAAARSLLRGEATLADVAGVSENDLADLRVAAGELLRRGMVRRAKELLDALEALGDAHPLLPFLRAECLEKSGDLAAATHCLRAAIDNARGSSLESLVAGAEVHLEQLVARMTAAVAAGA